MVDPDSGEIVGSELTTTEEGDASLAGPLLDQIPSLIAFPDQRPPICNMGRDISVKVYAPE